ncbi:MAG: hypothetical protein V3W37_08725 [Candidatus Binatia bacterium]
MESIANRGMEPYPSDVRAEAVALVYETGNFHEAARCMAERYPDRPPAHQIIMRWAKQADPEFCDALSAERKELLETGIMEMATKASQRLHTALDTIKDSQVAVPSGIAMDKALKLLEIRHGGNQMNVQFNLVTRE